jgi:hypothetical protein
MPVARRQNGTEATHYYYVAIHDADKTALLAGPYSEEPSEALRDRVREMAEAEDWRAWFYTFSLAKSSEQFPTKFGMVTIDTVQGPLATDEPPIPRRLR